MSEEFSLHRTTRRVENGYEIVTHTFPKDELYLLKIISSVGKDSYKKAVCEISGYPLEEWTRIKEITPIQLEDGGYKIEVWFRNPGKQFEEYIRKGGGEQDSRIYIDEDGNMVLTVPTDRAVDAVYEELEILINRDSMSYLDG